MRERDVNLQGEVFHLREWGTKGQPKLLMLHGFPEYGGAWAEVAERLADRFHCIAPDQRGYGGSFAPAEVQAYRMKHLVGDLVALVAELGGGPLGVVGHDWGSAAAYGLAIARPDLVSRLVILNGVHPAPFQRALATGGPQAEASQYMTFLRREGSEDILSANGHDRLLKLFAEGMDMSWMGPERATAYIAEWSKPGRLRGMVNWYRASPVVVPLPGETAPVPDLPVEKLRVRMPHLLIWGLGDRALLPVSTEGLEAYCEDLTRVEVADADHWIAHQKPDFVATTIRDWLAAP
ncbi:alpha/beta fold hydrolase [Pseudooceanicola sp. C21-150M6]|uniref:alpha/beta fold hydrolase n=1 Tax=Pseudooceanicola sp. C21-150M6 TaxID=3434355 RepID=UPI003D7F739E